MFIFLAWHNHPTFIEKSNACLKKVKDNSLRPWWVRLGLLWWGANCGRFPHVHVYIVYWTYLKSSQYQFVYSGHRESVLSLNTMYPYFTNLDTIWWTLFLYYYYFFRSLLILFSANLMSEFNEYWAFHSFTIWILRSFTLQFTVCNTNHIQETSVIFG